MTKREESKSEFTNLLREDLKSARKCKKGKPCGGRCIPANWNCRLKGEGDAPPTRGNLAKISPELKNKLAARRRSSNLSNFAKLALTAGGAAAAGAVLNKRGVAPKEVTQGAATAAGLVSAFNPAIAGPATLAALAAGAGAGLYNTSKKAAKFKARVSGVAAAASRTRNLIARRRTELAADRKAFNELQDKINNATDDKQRRKFVAESKVRLKAIGNNEAKIKSLLESVPGRERLVTRARSRNRITVGRVVRAATKGANETAQQARSIKSQQLKNRRALGLTSFGQPGAKVQFQDWRANPRNVEDSVDVKATHLQEKLEQVKTRKAKVVEKMNLLMEDAEVADANGKKYSKTVTNSKTGRKRTVKYGAKGYRIAPGTSKGDRYCARSFGDMKSHNKNCAGKDRNTPLCLSRAKWKCSGKRSRRDATKMNDK